MRRSSEAKIVLVILLLLSLTQQQQFLDYDYQTQFPIDAGTSILQLSFHPTVPGYFLAAAHTSIFLGKIDGTTLTKYANSSIAKTFYYQGVQFNPKDGRRAVASGMNGMFGLTIDTSLNTLALDASYAAETYFDYIGNLAFDSEGEYAVAVGNNGRLLTLRTGSTQPNTSTEKNQTEWGHLRGIVNTGPNFFLVSGFENDRMFVFTFDSNGNFQSNSSLSGMDARFKWSLALQRPTRQLFTIAHSPYNRILAFNSQTQQLEFDQEITQTAMPLLALDFNSDNTLLLTGGESGLYLYKLCAGCANCTGAYKFARLGCKCRQEGFFEARDGSCQRCLDKCKTCLNDYECQECLNYTLVVNDESPSCGCNPIPVTPVT